MEWSKAKDVLLAKEVLYLEPFQFKERTAQSVQAWQDLVNNLMKNYPGKFEKLTSRGTKDHIALLIKTRLDYQPLFGKMSPHSSPERVSFRGGSKTGPGRRRKSSLH